MIIDMHTHTFPASIASRAIAKLSSVSHTDAYTNGGVDGLLESMEQSGIDCSVIMPVVTRPGQETTVNQTAALLNERYSGRLLSFGGIHPESTSYKEILHTILEMGIPGIKIHPDYQNHFIDDPEYLRLIEYADSLGLVIMVHAGVDIGLPSVVHCTPERVLRMWEQVQPQHMILAHMGGWHLWDEVREQLVELPVYFDTSFSCCHVQGHFEREDGRAEEKLVQMLSPEEMTGLIRMHGCNRIVFGTDSPWSSQADSLAVFQELKLSDEEKKQVLGENAVKLLRL